MTFRGWPAEAFDFFEGLEADNSKAYWQAHKHEYETLVHAPMAALLDELADEFGEGRIFRPYRDVRFSRDKSPYKTNIAATQERGGYLTFSSEGLAAGCGYYMPTKDQLARLRAAVADDGTGKEIVGLIDKVAKKGVTISAHETLKTAPTGYPKEHPRIELLRMKGLICWRQWPVEPWLGTAKAKDRVVDFLRTTRRIVDWLDRNVGPTTLS